MRPPAIAVLGLGNVLLGDDGLGPWVIQSLLAGWEFDEAVEVLDLGTPGLDLLPYVAGRSTVIVVDTVRATGLPGEVRTWRKQELERGSVQPRLSPHDPGLLETLGTLDLAGEAPHEVTLVGVIPSSTATGTGLTPAVRAAVEPAIAAVLGELERLGLPARPKRSPEPPDVWWERPPAGGC